MEEHLHRCAPCAQELIALSTRKTPTPLARLRLVRRDREGHFEEFREPVAELLELALDQTDDLLLRAEVGGHWRRGPAPGVSFLFPEVSASSAFIALARMDPGATFPLHRHGGEERSLVLQGGACEEEGLQRWRGQTLHKEKGSSHRLIALPGPPCIAAIHLAGDLEFC